METRFLRRRSWRALCLLLVTASLMWLGAINTDPTLAESALAQIQAIFLSWHGF